MRNLVDALGRHASAAQHICQERTDVVRSLRAAEGNQKDCVEGRKRRRRRRRRHSSATVIIGRVRDARRHIIRAGALVIFAGSFLYRFLDLSFHNDHFEFVSLGAEIVDGAIPGVDFFDPTRPLQYYLSAAGLWLFGHQLLAEAVLSVGLMSLGTALVFVAGTRLSNSVTLGVLAAAFTAATLPRLYSYPKILLPAVALLAVWRFIDRPSPVYRNALTAFPRSGLAAMCLATAMSFYFRFDHGVWVGIALFSAIVTHDFWRWRQMAMHSAVYAGGVMLLCAPFVLFLFAMGGGVSSGPGTGRLTYLLKGEDVVSLQLPTVPAERPLVYFRPAGPQAIVRFTSGVTADQQASVERQYSLRFARFIDEGAARLYVLTDRAPATLTRLKTDPIVADVTNVDGQGHILRDPPWSVLRRWLHVPVMESPLLTKMNGAVWLYDALFFTPLVAAVLLIIRAVRHRTAEGEAAKVIATIVLGVLFNVFLIRDNLDSRLADVIVPGALLWAWMLQGPWLGLFERPVPRGAVARAAGWAVVMLSIWMSVDVYAGSINQLTATEMFSTPLHAARRLKGAIVNLRGDPLEQFAPPGSTGLRGLTRYINRCTAPTDRLLVLGYQPEMFFYADRRIGGGNVVFHANAGAAPQEQEIIVRRLRSQRVPVAILPVDQASEIERVYPLVKEYLDGRYELTEESGFGEGRPIRVLIDRNVVPSHIDAELGLPCFDGTPGSRTYLRRAGVGGQVP